MKKNGFSLIEVLGIIVIIGIILVITIPIIQSVIADSKSKLYNVIVSQIINNTKDYVAEYNYDISGLEGTGTGYVTINDLINKDIIDGTIKNPLTGQNFSSNAAVKITTQSNGTYKYEFCLEYLLCDYSESEGVNKPKLAPGMTAVKWNSGTSTWDTVANPDTDTSWYDYTNKEWANAKTVDGSMWVWIPRYIYKISSGWHSSTTGTINIQFSKGTNDSWNSSVIGNIDTGTTSAASNNKWTNEPAFTFGDTIPTSTELTGFWIAKFESSVSNTSDLCYTSESATNCDKTTLTPKIVPNVKSWRYITIGNMFTVSRSMETNNIYGWGTNGSGIDTHLMKNVEWGAVAYLSKSIYGKNAKIWINPANNYTTGCSGDSVSSASTTGCLRTYDTPNGVQASTTGNIYGIYDTSGGAIDYLAAYINNSNATTYGNSILIANNKYKDIYNIGSPDNAANNYNLTNSKKGDALYETSSNTGIDYEWFNEEIYMPLSINPWMARGDYYSQAPGTGTFNLGNGTGEPSNFYTFRPVLLVGTGL